MTSLADDPETDARWARIGQEILAWQDRIEGPPSVPQEPSSLWLDDRATDYFHTSHLAMHHLHRSTDHLHCLKSVVDDARLIHAGAPMTLLRAAHENAAAAVWLLHPKDRADRVLRRLQLAVKDLEERNKVRALTDQPLVDQLSDIEAIAAKAGFAASDLKPARGVTGYGAIVRDAGEYLKGQKVLHEVTWRASSGIAHGAQWPLVDLMYAGMVAHGNDNTATIKVELPTRIMVNYAALVTITLRQAWHLYDQRRVPWYENGKLVRSE